MIIPRNVSVLPNNTLKDNLIVNSMLVESSFKNHFPVLESLLNISLLQSTGYKNQTLSISCQNDELNTNTTITLQVDDYKAGIIIIIGHICMNYYVQYHNIRVVQESSYVYMYTY